MYDHRSCRSNILITRRFYYVTACARHFEASRSRSLLALCTHLLSPVMRGTSARSHTAAPPSCCTFSIMASVDEFSDTTQDYEIVTKENYASVFCIVYYTPYVNIHDMIQLFKRIVHQGFVNNLRLDVAGKFKVDMSMSSSGPHRLRNALQKCLFL